jgi:polyisoprenoid-binding protein YceI
VTTTADPTARVFVADPIHSTVAFAVRYLGGSTYRATFSKAGATLDLSNGAPTLKGGAAVDSVSISAPDAFRSHVLGPEFFDVENHPEITFESRSVDLRDDGTATIEGDLTIKGITRPVSAHGTWSEPGPDPMGHVRSHLALETTVNRREYQIVWDAPLPAGGSALGNEVTISADLALVARA